MSITAGDHEAELISVIIPTFNRERYVIEAIQSALDQDYGPIEVIVVDDGSSDGTAQAVAQFGSRILYLQQENRGVSTARNNGVGLSRGTFLAFLDSDDIWEPGKLSSQMAVFRSRPRTDVVYGHARQFFSPELTASECARIRQQEQILAAPIAPAMLIRRSAFDRVGPFDPGLNVSVDMDWYGRLIEAGLNQVMLPDVVYRRRLHRSNLNLQRADEQGERIRVLKSSIDRRRRVAGNSEGKN